ILWSLDNDLVRAHAVHVVEHAFGGTVQATLDPQGRKLVGHHPHRPTLRIAARAIGPIGQHLRRSLVFLPRTERTESALDLDGLAYKIGWALGAIRGNDDPSSHDGIFAQLWHS